MHSSRRRAPCAALLLAVLLPASAARAIDVRISSLKVDIDVHADGSYVETRELVESLESERAAHQAAQVSLPYSASLDELVIERAETLKHDGRHVPVPASSMFVQDGLISTNGLTSFQDIKTAVIAFPGVQNGDSIAFRTRLTRKTPMLPGIFTFAETFLGDVPYDDVHVTVTAPTGFPLQAEGIEVPMQGPVEADGRRRWEWTYSHKQAVATPADALAPLQVQPRILVSSVKSYDELAAAARNRFAGKSAVTQKVKSLADRITQGAKTPHDQALKIHEWVATNIRYFAVFLNVGGYVPRSADEVIETGYGDCKEHAVLLKALLAAKGIDSSVALIDTDALYELPPIPVLAAFNHAIVYVPGLDVWLESNVPSIPFGTLAWDELGKPALLIDREQPMSHTPLPTRANNFLRVQSRILIGADGNASGQDDLRASGPQGLAYNSLADTLGANDPVQFASSALVNAGFQGSGTATATRISNAADFHLTLLYDLPGFAPMTDAGAVKAVMPMDTLGGESRYSLSLPLSDTPYVCMTNEETESLTLVFPRGTRLTLPKNVDVSAPHRHYQATYQLQDTTVQVERTFSHERDTPTCQGSEQRDGRLVQQAIFNDLRSEIRYTPPSN